jgi:hypothetical protein
MKTMHMRLAVVGAIVGTVLAAAPSVGAQAPACTPRTIVEAISDDSGSMSSTDFDRLRLRGLNLFIDTNPSKTLGVIEFGSDAAQIFAPAVISSNAANMKNVLDARTQADDGATNYNAAFALARTENPNAQAWIFLTDGGHNVDEYMNGHVGGPPTFVIGFGSGLSPEDHARLAQIAADTGGRFYQQTDASKLQAVFNEISAALDCRAAPKTFTDTFTRVGQQKRHSLRIPNFARGLARPPRVIELVTTWSAATSRFTIPRKSIQIVRNGKVVASRSLRVKRVNGETFAIVRIRNVVRGKLVFKVKAVRLSSGFFTSNPNQAVTQVSFKN